MSWGFSSIFLYESFDVTDAEQREATWQFINSWRKGGGEKRYGIPDTIPKKETAAEKSEAATLIRVTEITAAAVTENEKKILAKRYKKRPPALATVEVISQ